MTPAFPRDLAILRRGRRTALFTAALVPAASPGSRTAPVNGWTDRQDGTSAHGGILRSHEKERGADTGAQSRICAAPGDLIYVTPAALPEPRVPPTLGACRGAARSRAEASSPTAPGGACTAGGAAAGWSLPCPSPRRPPGWLQSVHTPRSCPRFRNVPLPRSHPACGVTTPRPAAPPAVCWTLRRTARPQQGGWEDLGLRVASWELRLRSQGTGQPLPCLSPVWDPRIQKGQKDL